MQKCDTDKIAETIGFIKSLYPDKGYIPLHEPVFSGNERKYVLDAIDSTFVSSVGEYVVNFEQEIAQKAGASYGIATVNGTAALHIALIVSGVTRNDEVLTQAVSFIATSNAICYTGAFPVYIDVSKETLGMCPKKLGYFLDQNAQIGQDGSCYNKITGRRIKACVPMHTFGFPCEIDDLVSVCRKWNITLIEDAAESIGSYYNGKHTGSFGELGTFSFNGNKTITCGGGGAIVTNNESLAKLAKHLTTQAKVPHAWEFVHDQVGYNYRMPNLNAAMACAQLEQLEKIVANKRETAELYMNYFDKSGIKFVREPHNTKSNYWLNCVLLEDKKQRDEFLTITNSNGVMTRPVWQLMFRLPMFAHCQKDDQTNALIFEERLVNIPSSVRLNNL